jgi:hypothetical protein
MNSISISALYNEKHDFAKELPQPLLFSFRTWGDSYLKRDFLPGVDGSVTE